MTEEFEVIISNDGKHLLDSNVYIFDVGEDRGRWILRNSGDYLPDRTMS